MTQPLRFSALRQMAKSPAHYAAYVQREANTTSEMDIGSAADLMILGGQRVVAYPGKVRRGKEYDAFEVANADALIVTQAEYRAANGIAEAVAACPDATRILDGIRQRTVWWTNTGRECRGTPDVVSYVLSIDEDGPGRVDVVPYIADLKTSETSDPRRFIWKVKQFAYHAAASWYMAGLNSRGIEVRDAYIVAVEQAFPHVVTVFRLSDHLLNVGMRLWVTWFEQLQVCEASGEFPPYSQSIVDLDWPDGGRDRYRRCGRRRSAGVHEMSGKTRDAIISNQADKIIASETPEDLLESAKLIAALYECGMMATRRTISTLRKTADYIERGLDALETQR